MAQGLELAADLGSDPKRRYHPFGSSPFYGVSSHDSRPGDPPREDL